MPDKGAALTYRSLAGIAYRATLLSVDARGRGSIAVDGGCKEPVVVNMVGLRDGPTGETFVAWPREASGGAEIQGGG